MVAEADGFFDSFYDCHFGQLGVLEARVELFEGLAVFDVVFEVSPGKLCVRAKR
jgi:hypothetical protein